MSKLTAERLELAFRTVELRQALDAVLLQHGDAKLVLAWEGKWAYLQVHFPGQVEALTLAKVSRDGRVRYYREAEEMAGATGPKRNAL